ncbi:MAG: caspase family protein [Bacteroidota bacterium]
MEGSPRLFALLIGIAEYGNISAAYGVKYQNLPGCIPDVKNIKANLESSWPAKDLFVKTLINKEATKENIVKQILDYLGQASEGDTALLYISSHGAQEWCDQQVFSGETDGKLETIVCYYEKEWADFLLADKELRWLIHQLSQKAPHIVVILDCCHSEGGTRSIALHKEVPVLIQKTIPFTFPQRPWKHFVFNESISKDDFIKQGEETALPEGDHIALSACGSNQSAGQFPDGSVFTNTLLKVLQYERNNISYGQLISRVSQHMRAAYEQLPDLYTNKDRDRRLCLGIS